MTPNHHHHTPDAYDAISAAADRLRKHVDRSRNRKRLAEPEAQHNDPGPHGQWQGGALEVPPLTTERDGAENNVDTRGPNPTHGRGLMAVDAGAHEHD